MIVFCISSVVKEIPDSVESYHIDNFVTIVKIDAYDNDSSQISYITQSLKDVHIDFSTPIIFISIMN
jgi:hypothetical protein